MMPNLGSLITALLWIAALSLPLGMWKLAEIVWWIGSHVSIGLRP